jgi:hypothetical protein
VPDISEESIDDLEKKFEETLKKIKEGEPDRAGVGADEKESS